MEQSFGEIICNIYLKNLKNMHAFDFVILFMKWFQMNFSVASLTIVKNCNIPLPDDICTAIKLIATKAILEYGELIMLQY